MPNVTITGSTNMITDTTTQTATFTNALNSLIAARIQSGGLTPVTYTAGSAVPSPPSGQNGFVVIPSSTASAGPIALPTTIGAVSIGAAPGQAEVPVSITGGAAGIIVEAGSGGLTYTNITPSGTAIDYIVAGDGNNTISTSNAGTGNYSVNTGGGNDNITINGNSVVNAGGGNNAISIAGGNSYVYSEGFDVITGSTVVGGGGTDTINIGSGQTTINPGTSNFFSYGTTTTTNALVVRAGTGSDTISVGSGGGNIVAGTGGNSILFGGAGGTGSAPTALHGSANGDQIYAIGGGKVIATAGAGNELLTAAGGTPNGYSVPGSTASNVFTAGSGNDTLIAGAGADTLNGGSGTAVMQSGTGPTTFAFQFGSGGQDTITGFKSTDILQLSGFGVTALPSSTAGGNTVIALNDGTTITLTGVTVAQLTGPQVKLS